MMWYPLRLSGILVFLFLNQFPLFVSGHEKADIRQSLETRSNDGDFVRRMFHGCRFP